MKRSFVVMICVFFAFVNIYANDGIRKETYTYSLKGTDTLRLDKYDLPSVSQMRPCIIFMFGGGFVSGNHDSKEYIDYFNHLVDKGFTVVSIEYRLGMKGLNTTDLMRVVALLNNSISMAVEDLFDATAFVVDHAKEWNIDKNKIIANGSSAGAVSVLHGAYAISNDMEVVKKLPSNFNYAGIISFAGAIFSTNGDLEWKKSPAPIQMFHGDADSNVPYDKIVLDKYGFYGSKYIADQLHEMNSPYYFHVVRDAGHELAGRPMTSDLSEIESFLDKHVLKKQPLIIRTGEIQIGKPEVKKVFELTDYIKSNFGR